MAYESRVYVVNVHRHPEIKCAIYAETIAVVNMCKMDYNSGWHNLFTTDIDYKLFKDDGNTEFDTDSYGQHMKSCPVEKVIEWLETQMQRDNYRRLPVLHGLLSGFTQDAWPNIEVVHYGY